ncbi:TrkA-N domain-containing protein [Mycolicibacterium mageritense DSM 44476 = CIP 104973]|uniref:Potassium transporter n=1 Tax=Mycolicibacterium mageritense TaxID=53462 RepID=A0ABM7HQL2_MYCME|nr:TrkA family potassium uptake protein [Mycolicibacterium mageritense]MBN3459051.1 TrkA family potassium uptake protein [Mycobacterium sp. DSM 3803]MCC9183579.1 TrkA family potassium uptake protein [Mycolicibacterium mageritense]BBX32823.1 potassium transporter [Mycolicibacterium mageritense]CDO22639.1 Ktr system potassium uptake protein A [Mycolicibacterium mageritense DSM 44476 = CIP 104973]
MADQRNEPVVVIGLGRFGTAIASELTRRGTEVLAIDESVKVVQGLSGHLTQVVAADCTDIATLRELGVDEFYRAVVAVGTDIEASILITSSRVELEVEDVWAKAITSHHGRILERVGATHVVFPEREAGERVAHLVSGQLLDYLQVDDDFAIAKIHPPHYVVGLPLGQTKIRSKFGITVVAVKSGDEPFTYAAADTELAYDDTILVTGRVNDIDRFVGMT